MSPFFPRYWRLLLNPLDRNLLLHHIVHRTVARFYHFCLSNLSYNIQSLDNMSEDGVAAVEVRSWSQRNEKLAAVCIRAGVGHRKDACVVLEVGPAEDMA